MGFRYHGNYVGPGWSAGKYQPSVANSNVPAIDEFDQTGKDHDAAYAPTADRRKRSEADAKFFRQNFGRGIKRTAAAYAVGTQAFLRDTTGYDMSGNSVTSFPEKDPKVSSSSRKRVRYEGIDRPPTPSKRVRIERQVSPTSGNYIQLPQNMVQTMKRRSRKAKATRKGRKVFKKKIAARKRRAKKSNKLTLKDAFGPNAAVEKTETGGINEATNRGDVLYIGQAMPTKVMTNLVADAIVKKLLAMAGIQFTDWKEAIGDVFGYRRQFDHVRIIAYYRSGAVPTGPAAPIDVRLRIYTGVTVEATATFKKFGADLSAAIQAINPDEAHMQSWKWISFALMMNNGFTDASETNIPLALMTGEQAQITIGYTSTLRVQNRTNDASNTDSNNTNSPNPLTAKHYVSKKWANGFDLAKTTILANAATTTNLYANRASGLILADSSTFQTQALQKLPPKWVLGAAKEKRYMHHPGVIKGFTHTWTTRMNLNTLFQKIPQVFFSVTDTTYQKALIGNAEVIGFDFAIFDRSELTKVKVSWEINSTCVANVTLKKVRTLPILTVNV